jgi:cell division protein FtsW
MSVPAAGPPPPPPDDPRPPPTAAKLRSRATARARAWWDRPLTSYYVLVVSAGLLLVVGLVMVLSATTIKSYLKTGSPYAYFQKQLLWAAIGLVAFWIGLVLPVRMYRLMAYPLLVLSFVGLFAVLLPGVGITANGSTRWISVGGVNFQPSEVAKLGLALWGADLLVRKRRLLRHWKHLLVPLLPVASLIFALVMFEPDLGTTICLLLVVLGLLFVIGTPLRVFAALWVVILGAVVLLIAIEPYRLARITGFLGGAGKDPSDTGYQATQGLYSLSSGGLWGVGLGASRGKWGHVPNAYTDYIFAIIGEELGLAGCLAVLALFGAFAYAGIRIARRSVDPFVRLVAASCTIWLAGQTFINIGAVVKLLPITGIPLPLISFGGTSLMLTMFVIGMLATFARHEPEAATYLRARGRTRWAKVFGLPLPAPPPAPRRHRARASTAAARGSPRRQEAR